MPSKITISISPEPSSLADSITCVVYFNDPDMIGRSAKITVETHVVINKKRPVNKKKVYLTKKIKITENKMQFDIQQRNVAYYSYFGVDIKIISSVHVAIVGRKYVSSKASMQITRNLLTKPELRDNNHTAVDYSGKSSLIRRLRALPSIEQKTLIKKLLLGNSIFFAMLFIAVHDLWVGAELSYLYEIYDDSRLLLISMVTFIVLFFSTVFSGITIDVILSNSLQLFLNKKQLPRSFNKDSRCRVSELITAKAKTHISTMQVRVAAYNVERGKYITDNGSKQRKVAIYNFINEYILFEKNITNIQKGENLAVYLQDTVYFEKVFKHLYPRNMLSSNHGLDVQLEVQCSSHGAVHQTIILPCKKIKYSDFFNV